MLGPDVTQPLPCAQKCHELCGEKEALEAGIEDATVAQFPSKMAELGVDALVKSIRGEKVESLIDSGAALVTKDNMANF